MSENKMTEIDKARFWTKVKVTDYCWEWVAGRSQDGYGMFKLNGKDAKASRVAYAIVNGEIPVDLHVLHKCDNPCCVNPDHLFTGTHQDNMLDRQRKGRGKLLGRSSRYHGVAFRKDSNNWRAQAFDGKKHISLGSYKTEEEAARARDKAVIEKGLDLPLNFPVLTKERTCLIHEADSRHLEGTTAVNKGWVKCSDRLPGVRAEVKWRIGSEEWERKETPLGMWYNKPNDFNKYEWLDESGVAATPKWITADTKPEHNVGILVFIPGEDNHITSGMWDISNKWVLLDEYRTPEEEVTHWMPLPSFPDGFAENEIPGEWVTALKEIAREELSKKGTAATVWIRADAKRPDGWQLVRFLHSRKRFPVNFSPHVIADMAGKTYDPQYLEYLSDEGAAAAEREKEFTEADANFMRECDLYPKLDGTAQVITENDEGVRLDKDDLLKLAQAIMKYVKTKTP